MRVEKVSSKTLSSGDLVWNEKNSLFRVIEVEPDTGSFTAREIAILSMPYTRQELPVYRVVDLEGIEV